MGNKNQFTFNISWNCCEDIIKNIAEKIEFTIEVFGKNNIQFLKEIGFLSENEELTEKGLEFYKSKFIINDDVQALNILTSVLQQYKPVKLICDILWGYTNITKESIYRILVVNSLPIQKIALEDITGFIMLLNKSQIIKYSKKTGKIRIIYNPKGKTGDISATNNYFLAPEKPFSNIMALKKIIRSCDDYLWWIDKHFSTKGLEPLAEELDGNKIKEVKILLSINSSISFNKFRNEFRRFKEEMKNRGVKASCRVITDKIVINSIHDRWIIGNKTSYNIPPINSIYKGQYAEFNPTSQRPPFKEWWDKSKDLLINWNDIQKSL